MIIVTAADSKYKSIVEDSIQKSSALGFQIQVYDLGGLGSGIKFEEENESFKKNGYYELLDDSWPSRSLFKPKVIKLAMNQFSDKILWLDADAHLVKVPDFGDDNFDIGIALREKPIELKFSRPHYRYGLYNAGVILFNNTELARDFVDRWASLTDSKRNDQLALNILLSGHFQHFYDEPIRIREFSAHYNSSVLTDDTVIHHKKGVKNAV